jgi:hypothetical protein
MTSIGPGSSIRAKSITDCRGIEPGQKPRVELTFKRSQGKKEKNKYFVLLLLGVDDGSELSPEEALESMGWKFVGKDK